MQQISLAQLQNEMLRLLRLVIDTCRQHKLDYWIDSGTLLGATRHQGFIPWDDDLDVSLMKAEFDVLIQALESADLASQNAALYYGTENSSYWSDYLASDRYVMKNYRGDLIPCHIDLFPFKALAENDLKADKQLTNTAMFLVTGKVKFPELFDHTLKQKSRSEIIQYKRTWLREFNDVHIASLGSVQANSKYLSYSFEDFPYDYVRPKFLVEDVFPLKTTQFAGIEVKQPANPDRFLRLLYDDYMQLPAEQNRKPYNLEFYRVDQSIGRQVIKDYTAAQFVNFYDRHKLATKISRAIATLKHSGVKTLNKKIADYLRY